MAAFSGIVNQCPRNWKSCVIRVSRAHIYLIIFLQVLSNSSQITQVNQPAPSLQVIVTPLNLLINPKKKSEFVISNLEPKENMHLLDKFTDQLSNPISQIGFIEPGHGLWGKQQWLSSDFDLQEMYKLYMYS